MKSYAQFLTLVLFLSLLLGLSMAFVALPDQAFSEEENRSLRTLPRCSVESLLSGAYSNAINEYFADQFPMRDAFVGIKGAAVLWQGRGGNNGILRGRGGQLARRLFDMRRADGTVTNDIDIADTGVLDAAADAIERVDESLDLPFTVLLPPRPIDVAADAFDYPREIGDVIPKHLFEAIPEHISAIDLTPEFQARHRNGEYIYYRTDHHWTTRGAYYAYCALMREWGMEREILPEDAFAQVTASNAFYGTLWSAGGMKQIMPDSMELWTLGNEGDFSVTVDGRAADGFYNRTYLQKKDKYSTFLDGTHDVVTVTKKDGSSRPTLVIFKDSFANSIAPFLAQHFDLVLLNLSSTRTDFTNITQYAQAFGADRVLLLYSLENVITADRIGALH